MHSLEDLVTGRVKIVVLTDGDNVSESKIVTEDEYHELVKQAKQATEGNWYWSFYDGYGHGWDTEKAWEAEEDQAQAEDHDGWD